jgi:hypothetical protein
MHAGQQQAQPAGQQLCASAAKRPMHADASNRRRGRAAALRIPCGKPHACMPANAGAASRAAGSLFCCEESHACICQQQAAQQGSSSAHPPWRVPCMHACMAAQHGGEKAPCGGALDARSSCTSSRWPRARTTSHASAPPRSRLRRFTSTSAGRCVGVPCACAHMQVQVTSCACMHAVLQTHTCTCHPARVTHAHACMHAVLQTVDGMQAVCRLFPASAHAPRPSHTVRMHACCVAGARRPGYAGGKQGVKLSCRYVHVMQAAAGGKAGQGESPPWSAAS